MKRDERRGERVGQDQWPVKEKEKEGVAPYRVVHIVSVREEDPLAPVQSHQMVEQLIRLIVAIERISKSSSWPKLVDEQLHLVAISVEVVQIFDQRLQLILEGGRFGRRALRACDHRVGVDNEESHRHLSRGFRVVILSQQPSQQQREPARPKIWQMSD